MRVLLVLSLLVCSFAVFASDMAILAYIYIVFPIVFVGTLLTICSFCFSSKSVALIVSMIGVCIAMFPTIYLLAHNEKISEEFIYQLMVASLGGIFFLINLYKCITIPEYLVIDGVSIGELELNTPFLKKGDALDADKYSDGTYKRDGVIVEVFSGVISCVKVVFSSSNPEQKTFSGSLCRGNSILSGGVNISLKSAKLWFGEPIETVRERDELIVTFIDGGLRVKFKWIVHSGNLIARRVSFQASNI